jgi:hypothetical protein
MSDGITEAYKKVSKEVEIKEQLRYIQSLQIELSNAIDMLRQILDDK